MITKVMNLLPKHYKEVIIMRYFEGLPVAEIANELNLTIDNVYTRLRRAREKVKAAIGDEFYE